MQFTLVKYMKKKDEKNGNKARGLVRDAKGYDRWPDTPIILRERLELMSQPGWLEYVEQPGVMEGLTMLGKAGGLNTHDAYDAAMDAVVQELGIVNGRKKFREPKPGKTIRNLLIQIVKDNIKARKKSMGRNDLSVAGESSDEAQEMAMMDNLLVKYAHGAGASDIDPVTLSQTQDPEQVKRLVADYVDMLAIVMTPRMAGGKSDSSDLSVPEDYMQLVAEHADWLIAYNGSGDAADLFQKTYELLVRFIFIPEKTKSKRVQGTAEDCLVEVGRVKKETEFFYMFVSRVMQGE